MHKKIQPMQRVITRTYPGRTIASKPVMCVTCDNSNELKVKRVVNMGCDIPFPPNLVVVPNPTQNCCQHPCDKLPNLTYYQLLPSRCRTFDDGLCAS